MWVHKVDCVLHAKDNLLCNKSVHLNGLICIAYTTKIACKAKKVKMLKIANKDYA